MVQALHNRGISHGNILLSNIFLDSGLRLILTDFSVLASERVDTKSSQKRDWDKDIKDLGYLLYYSVHTIFGRKVLYFIFSGHNHCIDFDDSNFTLGIYSDLNAKEFQIIKDMLWLPDTLSIDEILNHGYFTNYHMV